MATIHDIVTSELGLTDRTSADLGPTDLGPISYNSAGNNINTDTGNSNGVSNLHSNEHLNATTDSKDVHEFKPVLDLSHTEDADPAERSRRASQIDWLNQQSQEYERKASVVKGVGALTITEDESNPAERARRASQVEWLKRESQIGPHDTATAAAAVQRERRPSKYPDNPFLGNINETLSSHNKAKKWKISDGDFKFGMPKKPSNASAQGIRRDGSISYEDGLPGPRGLFPNERRSIDRNVVSDHDKAKKWSLSDGDFKFGMPKKPSNASTQGIRRDGSISYEDGLPGPRGLFPNERASIDEHVVSKHDKARKWSIRDGNFGFGMPNKPSNADAQGIPGPYTRKSVSVEVGKS